jgi:cytidylate kinase
MVKIIPYKNIAISGDISSGKSTLARNLANALGWKNISAGSFFREWHQKNNIPVQNPEEVPEELDRKIDGEFKSQMKESKNVIFESHLAGWLAKDLDRTFKILITADFDERMRRAALREDCSIKDAIKQSERRAKLLADKFKKLYGVDNSFNKEYFDLFVDSTKKSKEEVLETALKALEEKRI